MGATALPIAFGSGQLGKVIDALKLSRILSFHRANGSTGVSGDGNDIRQQVFTLFIVRGEARGPGFKEIGLSQHNPGIHLTNQALRRGGISFFNDLGDRARIITNDPPIVARVRLVNGQNRQRRSALQQ